MFFGYDYLQETIHRDIYEEVKFDAVNINIAYNFSFVVACRYESEGKLVVKSWKREVVKAWESLALCSHLRACFVHTYFGIS